MCPATEICRQKGGFMNGLFMRNSRPYNNMRPGQVFDMEPKLRPGGKTLDQVFVLAVITPYKYFFSPGRNELKRVKSGCLFRVTGF